MKKLLLLLILSFVCVLSLTACEEKPQDQEQQQEEELSKELKAGQSFLKALYDAASTSTAADYTRVGKAAECTVVWTVNVTNGNADDVKVSVGENGMYTIDVNEKVSQDVTYTLTATITYNGESTTLSYNYTIPKFQELSYAEYATKAKGDAVVVKGIVVGILSKELGDTVDGLFLHTPEGGFYIYGVANTAEIPMSEYKLGQEVRASGTMDIYNGTLEVKDATCEILNATPASYEGVDLTEAFKNAESLTDEALVGKQAMLVTIKGVTIADINVAQGYYYFELDGLKAYSRISSSTCPLNAADSASMAADWAEHTGWVADVTGVVSVYSGAFYIQPVTLQSAAVYKSLPQLSDAEAVEFEAANLTVSAKEFSKNDSFQVAVAGAAYSDVAISWASDNELVTVDAEGNVAVTIGSENATVKLTATVSRGEASVTKEFTIKLVATVQVTSIADALALGAAQAHNTYTEDKYVLVGVVTEVQNTTYGNLVISDGTNSILVYGTYSADGSTRYDKLEVQPQVGDTITVKGALGQYNGTAQMKNGWILLMGDITIGETTSIADALALGAAQAHNTYTEDKYVLVGEVTEVQNTTYGNLVISDGTNSILVYGTYSADGSTRYDKLEVQPQVGDTIVVKGALGQYNGTAQMKNGWILKVEVAEQGEEPAHEHELCEVCGKCVKADCTEEKCAGHEEEPTPTPNPETITIAQALEIGGTYAKDSYSTEKYTIVGTIVEVQSTTYGNVVISDGTNSILVYGLYSADGSTRYDAMETKPSVGDVITVTGVLGKYSAAQMKNGWLLDLVEHVCKDYTEATCKVPALCVVCGEAKDDVLSETHDYVEGVCSICNAVDPNYEGEVKEVATEAKSIFANQGSFNSGAKTITWTGTAFTLEVSQGSNNNAIRTTDTDHFRIYQGNNVVLSCAGMKKVVFTCATASYAEVLKNSISDTNVEVTVSGTVVTVTVKSGTLSALTFTTTAQTRINKIEVTYEK